MGCQEVPANFEEREPAFQFLSDTRAGRYPAVTLDSRLRGNDAFVESITRSGKSLFELDHYVIGIQRASRNAGTISRATAIARAGLAVAKRTSVASSITSDSNIVLMAV